MATTGTSAGEESTTEWYREVMSRSRSFSMPCISEAS
jgi:hypothetical protein